MNVLNGKVGLIVSLEADGLDTQETRAFQVSILFGRFGTSGKWHEKTWRIEGIPVSARYLSSLPVGVKDEFPDSGIESHQSVMESIHKILVKCDVLCAWHQGYHVHLLATELRRAGLEMPEIHVVDPLLIFKNTYRYQKGLKRTLEGAVDWYGSTMDDFGSAAFTGRKVLATQWVLDRLQEDAGAEQFFLLKNLDMMTQKQASQNAMDHISMKEYLTKKGEDTSKLTFKPWPTTPNGYDRIEADEAPFDRHPELAQTFAEATIPYEKPAYTNVVPFNDFTKAQVHILRAMLVSDIENVTVRPPETLGVCEVYATYDDSMSAFTVTITTQNEKDMKDLLKEIETIPVSFTKHADAKFLITDTELVGLSTKTTLKLVSKSST